ncbi:MAG: choice-of-anchor tandem repeat NxxGxxAF-containing protein [Phormidium sp.]
MATTRRLIYRGEAILTFNRESFTTIADSKTSFFCFPSSVAINDNSTVVFVAELDTGNRGIFKFNGGYTKQIAELPAKDALSIYDPMITRVAINKSGTVAFTYWEFVDFLPGYSALYINDSIDPIADNIGKFAPFTNLAINDEAKLVFSADLASGNQGIFLYDGKEIIEIANNNYGSYFQDFSLSNPAINNQGTVAFFAEQNFSGDNSYQGIFTGSNPETDKVIAVGDDLLGSKVKKLSFSSQGLNNLGQIAFYAELENGTKGFFLANPRLKSVSEPISVFSLLTMVADGLTMKRSQENII